MQPPQLGMGLPGSLLSYKNRLAREAATYFHGLPAALKKSTPAPLLGHSPVYPNVDRTPPFFRFISPTTLVALDSLVSQSFCIVQHQPVALCVFIYRLS